MAETRVANEASYARMQKSQYEELAAKWSPESKDFVVGTYDQHDVWPEYDLLFRFLPPDTSRWRCLDWACGPGRNIIKYSKRFRIVDGVDISRWNILNAKTWLKKNSVRNCMRLYECNGRDLALIPSGVYDCILSTIAFQHICVHATRLNYLREFFRTLRPGGYITLQMGYGSPSPNTVAYDANFYEAKGTNRAMDVCVESPQQIEHDVLSVGFINFNYTVGKCGPGDCHPAWIYFSAQKPF